MRKARAKRKIEAIRRQLEELEQETNPDLIHPEEVLESTLVVQTRAQRKRALLNELAEIEQELKALEAE